MNFIDEIIRFNTDRKLSYDFNVEINMLEEEFTEFRYSEDEPHEAIDALCDLIVLCVGAIHLKGYNVSKCMLEATKEINSRDGEINKNGKFEKFKTPEAIAKWYKADYTKCKYENEYKSLPYISGFEPEY